MKNEHRYTVQVLWTGNRGAGTSDYRSYGRDHLISAEGKTTIDGSSDRVFHGDAERWNPEELLLSALSQCHLLSYLHVAAANGVLVTGYADEPVGTMVQSAGGGGHFTHVVLRPIVRVESGGRPAEEVAALATRLHVEASEKCFIAASVNFPVRHEPVTVVAPLATAG